MKVLNGHVENWEGNEFAGMEKGEYGSFRLCLYV